MASFVETARLSLHVLAATIWVGGQFTLAALLPVLRNSIDPDVSKRAAQAFNRVAWYAFGVLVITGVWNIAASADTSGEYGLVLTLKLIAVATSGLTAYAHIRSASRARLAVYGADDRGLSSCRSHPWSDARKLTGGSDLARERDPPTNGRTDSGG